MKLFVVTIALLICASKGRRNKIKCEKDLIADLLALTPKEKAARLEVCNECMIKHNVYYKSLVAVQELDLEDVDYETKCYFQCYYEGVGASDGTCVLRYNIIQDWMAPGFFEPVDSCRDAIFSSSDFCEATFNHYTCVLKDVYDRGLLDSTESQCPNCTGKH